MLVEYDWPGNVRELENTIERAVILAQGGVVTTHHLVFNRIRSARALDLAEVLRRTGSLHRAMEEVEDKLIYEALDQANGDTERAAALLEIGAAELAGRLPRD